MCCPPSYLLVSFAREGEVLYRIHNKTCTISIPGQRDLLVSFLQLKFVGYESGSFRSGNYQWMFIYHSSSPSHFRILLEQYGTCTIGSIAQDGELLVVFLWFISQVVAMAHCWGTHEKCHPCVFFFWNSPGLIAFSDSIEYMAIDNAIFSTYCILELKLDL